MGKKNKRKDGQTGEEGGPPGEAAQPGSADTQRQEQSQQSQPGPSNRGNVPSAEVSAQQSGQKGRQQQRKKGTKQQEQGASISQRPSDQQLEQTMSKPPGQQEQVGHDDRGQAPPQQQPGKQKGPGQQGQQKGPGQQGQQKGPGQQQQHRQQQQGQQQQQQPSQRQQQQPQRQQQQGQQQQQQPQQWQQPPQQWQQPQHMQGQQPSQRQQQQPQRQQQQSQQQQQPQQLQGQQQMQQGQPRTTQQQQQQLGRQQGGQHFQPMEKSPASSVSSSSSSLYKGATSAKGSIVRGTIGRPGSVEVNYLNIVMDKMPSVAYHYDVEITPNRPKKFLRPAFAQFNRQFYPKIAMFYDGQKSFYTTQKLPVESDAQDVEIDDSNSRKISINVAIKETVDMEIDLSSLQKYFKERVFDKPMRALQCLEVVLANPCHDKGLRVGRSFFIQPQKRFDLNDGYEMWTGLFQAAILGDVPFLNVDVSHKSFPSACSLVDYVQNNFRDVNPNQPLNDRSLRDLKEFLRDLNIEYEPPAKFGALPRRYKVLDVSDESADNLTVTLDDGSKITVAGYFNKKGYNLKYPRWNCIKVGSTVKSIHLPIELCRIPAGQALNKKDGARQVQQMIRFSATSTNERKAKIMTLLNYFNHNMDIGLQKFGIQIGRDFQTVAMRVLKSPQIEYFACEMITPFKGAWRMNDSTKFLQTKQLPNGHQWAVIYSDRSRMNYNFLQNFFGKVSDLAKKLNMTLAPKPQIIKFNNVSRTLADCKKNNMHLVFVVIPKFGVSYAQIKQEAELKVGMLTQCILENTIERRNDMQTVANILLKVNGKLNGTNHRINPQTNIRMQNVMFLGADVTHPSPDQRHIPSVVGVAASHDLNGACYNMQYRLQKSTVENIEDMNSIFSHHLRIYFQYNGKYPDHIIYYRDGVSDGQFPIVKNNELRDIRAACSKVRCNPKLTCVVAIKRHHTRFFPKTQNPRDKFNNVEPGTVVDTVIVHPNEVQFFMVSHQSIQGTAKPTRYNVIEDDARMDINDLQTLTYNLCHMFPRCNRVVSYPAPAYLAHLVAFRGRVYIEGNSRFGDPKKEYEKRLVNTDFMKNNPMYFI